MEDDLTDPLGLLDSTDAALTDLNGSTAPNSSPLPLSTPVNTSGGNTNTSGSFFGSLISGLSGLGTSAANAYAVVSGKPTTAGGAAPVTTASSLATYLPWILIGGVVLLVVMLFRKK